MLIPAHRQEGLSRAYVHAIASRCGLGCSFREFDYGIDLSVHAIRQKGQRYFESGFNLDIQAKSSTRATLTPSTVMYDLEVKNYDDLRDIDVGCPRILVLLLLPEDEEDWTEQSESNLLLRRCAYWLSLRGMEPTTNTASVRITIPRANIFSINILLAIMDRIRKREPL